MSVAIKTLTIANECVKAEFAIGPESVQESFYALRHGTAILVAQGRMPGALGATLLGAEMDSGNRDSVAPDLQAFAEEVSHGRKKLEEMPALPSPSDVVPPCAISWVSTPSARVQSGRQELVFSGITANGDRIERTVSLGPNDPFFRIQVTFTPGQPVLLEYLNDQFTFAPEGKPDFTWTPLLKRKEEDRFPDWSYKTPAAFVQKGNTLLALVPDVDDLRKNETWRQTNLTLDLDARPAQGPLLSFGLVPTVFYGHCAFMHIPGQRAVIGSAPVRYSYFMLLDANVPERQAHRHVVSFVWDRFGHEALLEGHDAQAQTFASWQPKTWDAFADEMWWEFERAGVPCGSIRIHAFVEKNAWFCAWWNNMRTAYAMELYARRAKLAKPRERAAKILNLALDAPQTEGAFPALFMWTDVDGEKWYPDHAFGGIIECYHAFDMAWTGYWLLKWYNDFGPSDCRILPRCVALGDFLVRHQQASGFIPSYFNTDFTLKDDCRLNRESAECAACAVFLFELHQTVGEERYLASAVRVVDYVQREIVPEAKWFDFETFLSCSPKPYDFYDPITNQHPQNNMGTIQAAMAFLAAYDATDDPQYLEQGMNVLDYLSLTQQVWSHPHMTPNLIGGFTTQNSDAEWSDARQAHCATVYLDYFERSGKKQYLERGIAALRAGFAVAPYENWAHIGFFNAPGALSGYHWGQGSAMASVEMVWPRYGDILVDMKNGWAYGINGCTVDALQIDGTVIRLGVRTKLAWHERARIVFRDVPEGEFGLIVNGRKAGVFNNRALLEGVMAELLANG